MAILYDVLMSPEFRRAFLRLEGAAQKRVDAWIYKLRAAEVSGTPHDEGWEIETEAGEIVDFEYQRRTIVLLNIREV
ncbi:MAG: hypothetical protein A3G34_11210 [Candidatus Lindowbacteria bacterium RIFCSPLOWO2_12_FULL_62_27]|nr:MAG: hypothetical protein A3G34_11210 [Candidatus Lindowbacteria bacterium RIFCSPLOWO2_12_FULL_62_27]OGH63463.1 MAG: hypothetical protein A3I06_06775 [Candidatus Lindowbacteria bacterium RIFCSPLOWO2_02_FULL_62_12]